MGCSIDYLLWLCENEYLKPGFKVLDVGEQCLLATSDDKNNVKKLVSICDHLGLKKKFSSHDEFMEYIHDCSWRSTIIGHPTKQTLFLGDILTATSVEYVSIDICCAKYAEYFDLNFHSIAKKFHNYFDAVFNFGTTEHILNQYNCFKQMHDACAPGGYIHAQIPGGGFVNHGYFNYDALLFSDLASANDYDIEKLWYNSGGAYSNVIKETAKNYPSVLDSQLFDSCFELGALDKSRVFLINVLMRKKSSKPFYVVPEVRTAAAMANHSGSSLLISKAWYKSYFNFVDVTTLAKNKISGWSVRIKDYCKKIIKTILAVKPKS